MALFVWVVLQCAAHYGFVFIFSLFACLLRLWGLAAGLTQVPHPLSIYFFVIVNFILFIPSPTQLSASEAKGKGKWSLLVEGLLARM